jgi:hypothetical protein
MAEAMIRDRQNAQAQQELPCFGPPKLACGR